MLERKKKKSCRILSASTTLLSWQGIRTCMGKSGIDWQICPICSSSGHINSKAPVSYLCWVCSVSARKRKTIHLQLLKKLLPYQLCCDTAENARDTSELQSLELNLSIWREETDTSQICTLVRSLYPWRFWFCPSQRCTLDHCSIWALLSSQHVSCLTPTAQSWSGWRVTSDKEWQERICAEIRYTKEDPGT